MISIRRSLSQFIRLNSRHGYHNVSHSAESDLLAEGEKKLRKVYKDMFGKYTEGIPDRVH